MSHVEKKRFCSWSGGKDSCLAFHRSTVDGAKPSVLVTMLAEDGRRSRAHGLSTSALGAQASALGVRLITRATSWGDYEDNFLYVVGALRDEGVSAGVFGDIDVEGHREWVERVCRQAGVEAVLPLWRSDRRTLLDEFISAGFKATIVSVKDGVLDRRFLGRTLDNVAIEELEALGIDISGEGGEYHTFVTDGPMFRSPVKVAMGRTASHGGYSFLDMAGTHN